MLERTLGVPLFQEQMLQMAMVMAQFTGDEAEELRRAMSFHRSDERMSRAKERLRSAMDRAGVTPDIAERIIQAVGSFALYGFPESHAISFAHLAYASAYLKAHRPAEFFCALLNNQPMGFYSPATLVKDAKRHGVHIRPVCVQRSNWETLLEPPEPDSSIERHGNGATSGTAETPASGPKTSRPPALRLGLRLVQGLRQHHAQAMLVERGRQKFTSMEDFKRRTHFSKDELRALAEIGALNGFAPHRRAALWETERTVRREDLFDSANDHPMADALSPANGIESSLAAAGSPLAPMNALERLQADYAGLRLTTGPHPMAMLRPRLSDTWRAGDLPHARNGEIIRVAGQVICRQRPGTAKGVCFISLEDETGISNVVVWPQLFEAQRLVITMEPFLAIEGRVQSKDGTIHVVAHTIERLDFKGLQTGASHDFS